MLWRSSISSKRICISCRLFTRAMVSFTMGAATSEKTSAVLAMLFVTTQVPKSCKTGSMQFMLRPMHFQMPTDEEIHTAFEQGEAAVLALFHDVAAQVTELAQQLAKQAVILHELQARLAKSSRNSSK